MGEVLDLTDDEEESKLTHSKKPPFFIHSYGWKMEVFAFPGPEMDYISAALTPETEEIKNLSGHADIDTTQHYLHVQREIKERAADRLNQVF